MWQGKQLTMKLQDFGATLLFLIAFLGGCDANRGIYTMAQPAIEPESNPTKINHQPTKASSKHALPIPPWYEQSHVKSSPAPTYYEPSWKSQDPRPYPTTYDGSKAKLPKPHPIGTRYEPNWKSLDSRPLPAWYDEAKIGIFLHWGVFSVPSYVGAWFWYYWKSPKPMFRVVEFMRENYRPGFTYADFGPQFKAEFYSPDYWAGIFKGSGAQYVVLTTKHHEGFCNWPTKYSWNWNSMDIGPNRDLVGELAKALRRKGLRFGAYHSLFEFYNPLYLEDKRNNFTTQTFVEEKTMPELYELVNMYKPDLIWSDGEWEAPDTYWNATNFLAWLYNDSPVKDVIVTNDRWGSGTMCHHGGYLTCHDKYNPGSIQKRKFEDSTTMDKVAWGYRRDLKLSDVHTMEEVVFMIATVVSCGGNLLINVGPTKEGTIVPIFEERLGQMGEWLRVNGEGIYATRPWIHANDTLNSDVWYTSKKSPVDPDMTTVYAILLKWPEDDRTVRLALPIPGESTVVSLLGYTGDPIPYSYSSMTGMKLTLPIIPASKMPCQWGWVFKLTNILN